jgi:hypothetical protein
MTVGLGITCCCMNNGRVGHGEQHGARRGEPPAVASGSRALDSSHRCRPHSHRGNHIPRNHRRQQRRHWDRTRPASRRTSHSLRPSHDRPSRRASHGRSSHDPNGHQHPNDRLRPNGRLRHGQPPGSPSGLLRRQVPRPQSISSSLPPGASREASPSCPTRSRSGQGNALACCAFTPCRQHRRALSSTCIVGGLRINLASPQPLGIDPEPRQKFWELPR